MTFFGDPITVALVLRIILSSVVGFVAGTIALKMMERSGPLSG